MTIERVQDAAWLRGIYFSGEKKFRNTTVGCAYEIYTPDGRGFFQSESLDGIYRKVMKFPKVNN